MHSQYSRQGKWWLELALKRKVERGAWKAYLANENIRIILNENLDFISKLLHYDIFSSTFLIQESSLTYTTCKVHPSFLCHALGKVARCLVYSLGLKESTKTDLKNGLNKRTVFYIGLPLCNSSPDSKRTRGKAVNHKPKISTVYNFWK